MIRAFRPYDLAMSLALAFTVKYNFDNAMTHCDNLVEVHQRAGSGERGRRRIETSVNRAVIVIAIASWQAVVQDMARFLLDRNMPEASDPNYGVARLIRGRVLGELDRFSTPNAQKTRELRQSVGFDPRPYWKWSRRDSAHKIVTLRSRDIEEVLRDWA